MKCEAFKDSLCICICKVCNC